jgi:hypothetical protein
MSSKKSYTQNVVNLTIFAVPKAFHGLFAIIQRNAIKSWTHIRPRPEIILLGDDSGTEETARDLGTKFIPEIRRNEFGTPLLNDIFEKAEKAASNSILCYVNSDIILPTDFGEIVARITFKRFLIVGQRWNLEIKTELDFTDPDCEKKLNDRRKAEGDLEPVSGVDYFIYRRGCINNMPPFALGRTAWDNWLVFKARLSKIPVIDATQVLTVIHQKHDYGPPERQKMVLAGPERERNLELGGGYENMFTIDDANYVLLPEGTLHRKTEHHREPHLKRIRYSDSSIFHRVIQKLLDPPSLWLSVRVRLKRFFVGC